MLHCIYNVHLIGKYEGFLSAGGETVLWTGEQITNHSLWSYRTDHCALLISQKLKWLSLFPLCLHPLSVDLCFRPLHPSSPPHPSFFIPHLSSAAPRRATFPPHALSPPLLVCGCKNQVAVGEVVRAANGDHLPADLVILSSRSGNQQHHQQNSGGRDRGLVRTNVPHWREEEVCDYFDTSHTGWTSFSFHFSDCDILASHYIRPYMKSRPFKCLAKQSLSSTAAEELLILFFTFLGGVNIFSTLLLLHDSSPWMLLFLLKVASACISVPRCNTAAWNLTLPGFPQHTAHTWSADSKPFQELKVYFPALMADSFAMKGRLSFGGEQQHIPDLSLQCPKPSLIFLHFLVCLDRTLAWINHPSENPTALPAHLKHRHALPLCPCAQSLSEVTLSALYCAQHA